MVVSISGMSTLAELTNSAPFSLRTVMFWPWAVRNVAGFPGEIKSVLNLICCARTWYARIPARVCCGRVPTMLPMASNASLDGANIVTSVRPFMPSTSWAVVKAPASDVSPVLMAVWAGLAGTVRTSPMTWMRPPLKGIS